MGDIGETTAVPRVMIAAPNGRSGKTVVSLGLMRALRRRGLAVQPFKKGPDFIDPGWHAVATGRTGRNLDRFFMGSGLLRHVLCEASAGVDACVIEAAMGLYDGLDAQGSTSSAEIAKATDTPVVLVLDVTRMTRTAGAVALGMRAFDPDVRIAGIILNKVRGERQRSLVSEVIERTCGVPVIGAVLKDACMGVPDRHLGLVTSAESIDCERLLDGMAAHVERCVDVDAVLSIARSAPPVTGGTQEAPIAADGRRDAPRAVIGVMRDEAFSFYYPENLEALERGGARLTFVNSMRDAALPDDLDGLYIGGGFPEEFAARLEAGIGMRESIRRSIEGGMPVFAECGGLLYLGRTLTYRGRTHSMVGALGLDAIMHDAQRAHGYARCAATGAGWLAAGTVLVGHEHHHSTVVDLDPDSTFALSNERGRGVTGGCDGVCRKNVIAGYLHVNALASPDWAPSFVDAAARFHAAR
ncbi:cobyrinate a,c-diamide synthase [Rubneribacter badeniensis]|uniref:cobyrinate a,c-diamide synthase n=1 Tax=Rubneribacter badeniensis TaxID=2070688 RepID=UPI003A90729E